MQAAGGIKRLPRGQHTGLHIWRSPARCAAATRLCICGGKVLEPVGRRPPTLRLLPVSCAAGNGAFARDLRATVPATFDVIHADDTIVRHGG